MVDRELRHVVLVFALVCFPNLIFCLFFAFIFVCGGFESCSGVLICVSSLNCQCFVQSKALSEATASKPSVPSACPVRLMQRCGALALGLGRGKFPSVFHQFRLVFQ